MNRIKNTIKTINMAYVKLRHIKLKLKAILDILTNKRFYLITFDKDDEIKHRTKFGIDENNVIDKHFKNW